MIANKEEPFTVSVPEAGRLLGVSPATVKRYIAAGRIPARRTGEGRGARVLIERADVITFLKGLPLMGSR